MLGMGSLWSSVLQCTLAHTKKKFMWMNFERANTVCSQILFLEPHYRQWRLRVWCRTSLSTECQPCLTMKSVGCPTSLVSARCRSRRHRSTLHPLLPARDAMPYAPEIFPKCDKHCAMRLMVANVLDPDAGNIRDDEQISGSSKTNCKMFISRYKGLKVIFSVVSMLSMGTETLHERNR